MSILNVDLKINRNNLIERDFFKHVFDITETSQSSFDLPEDICGKKIILTYNGLKLIEDTDYVLTETTLTIINSNLDSDDKLEAVYLH